MFKALLNLNEIKYNLKGLENYHISEIRLEKDFIAENRWERVYKIKRTKKNNKIKLNN